MYVSPFLYVCLIVAKSALLSRILLWTQLELDKQQSEASFRVHIRWLCSAVLLLLAVVGGSAIATALLDGTRASVVVREWTPLAMVGEDVVLTGIWPLPTK